MIFGRWKKKSDEVDDDLLEDDDLDASDDTDDDEDDDAAAAVDDNLDDEDDDLEDDEDDEDGDDEDGDDEDGDDEDGDDEDGDDEDGDDEDGDDEDGDDEDGDDEDDDLTAEVDHSLRDDGPFDIEEVDLDADDVDRLDLGCLIVTPFEGMQLQLQVDEATQTVQSALVLHAQSALEIALFAAPARDAMVSDVVDEMDQTTVEAGGSAETSEGAFGREITRTIPIDGPDGQKLLHVSRTWFVQGPRWLLRGSLMGDAITGDATEDAELLLEFFRNLVVRRDQAPRVPGDLIAMTMPEGLVPSSDDGDQEP